jgi:CBS domain-containing protein
LKASQIMTSPVITVSPETPVREIAALLFHYRISAVPVLRQGRMVGIVSEADLLQRHEIATDSGDDGRAWWLRIFSSGDSPTEYVKAHAMKAVDIMNPEIVSVSEDATVAKIARLLTKHRIKRVPVMHGSRLVGIVSRSNLVRALATQGRDRPPDRPADDESIRRELVAELERHPWWHAIYSNVTVTQGVVHFHGLIDSAEERRAARVAAENVAGVRAIEDHRVGFHEGSSML